MNHFTVPDFWRNYNALPAQIQELADKNFALLKQNPSHSSLQFKETKTDVWSARVGLHYRAVAFREDQGFFWFFIGTHAEYDRLLNNL